MKIHSKFRLSQYSIFAATFLICKDGYSEAIYTDIDPDIVLSADNDYFNIDMDNDGLFDFKLWKSSGPFYSYWSEHLSYAYYMAMAPWQSGDKIAGLKSVIDPSYGGFTQYFPFVLTSMQQIDEGLSFQNNNFEVLAYIINSDGGVSQANGGNWLTGVESKFIGVQFKDTSDCFHFGWIRCSITAEASSLVIHDYAYETKCETGIMAGDIIGDTTTVGITEAVLIEPKIYSYSGTIIVNIDKQLLGANFSITNLEGKLVNSGCLNDLNNIFTSIQGDRMYIITLEKGTYKYSKNIILF